MAVRTTVLFSTIAVLIAAGVTNAQATFTYDLDDAAGWTIVQDPDASATFGFDYSLLGIPPGPHGQTTIGLRMAANIDEPGEVAAVSASPDALTVRGQYTVQFDFWVNYHIDPGLVGTTEFIGGIVGFDASADEPLDGAGFLGDSDGDTSRDFRLYKNDEEQLIDSGQYDLFSQNNDDIDLQDHFPGQTTPQAQTDPANFDPPNELVTAADGTLAFGWHTLAIEVDADAGLANFAVDGLSIGTIDNTVGSAVNLEGGIALTFADLFTSVSTNPEFSFGVFDNLMVTQFSAVALMAGDANMDLRFDQVDLVRVQIAAKYLTGQPATWGEGDWDAAPGGEPGNPPTGNGRFDQVDIISALAPGHYLTGLYAAITDNGQAGDDQTSLGYNADTGEVWVDAPRGRELTSVNIDSRAGVLSGAAANNLGGSFDNDSDTHIFKATFGSSFSSLSFGGVAHAGLSEDFVLGDFSVIGSLAGGGELGTVDLIYVPEPSAIVVLLSGILILASVHSATSMS